MFAESWVSLAGLFMTVFAAIWSLAWWLSGKFNYISDHLGKRIESVESNLMRKIEYHERHDDTRFSNIHNDLWELRIQNAAREGRVSTQRKVKTEDGA